MLFFITWRKYPLKTDYLEQIGLYESSEWTPASRLQTYLVSSSPREFIEAYIYITLIYTALQFNSAILYRVSTV